MNNKKITVHMVGNAHLDPAWLWRWNEGCEEAISTFQSAIERIKETPEFIFTKGESSIYEFIEECAPLLFKKIKKYIREGKIWVVNAWIVQADCNIPSGESFVRQALYGKKYFRKKFGIDVKTAYCVDSFGHNANLPQILKKCGYELYVFGRPGKIEKPLSSSMFWWEARDGSKILCFRVPYWTYGFYCLHVDDMKEHINNTLKDLPKGVSHTMCLYGVGNHGGGPTKKQIEYIKEHANHFKNSKLMFSHPYNFSKEIRKQAHTLPVVREELNPHAVGCYSSCSEIKRLNRESESLLISTERFATVVSLLMNKIAYPQAEIEKSWKNVLFNQFHDIICGCSIQEVYRDGRDSHGEAQQIGKKIMNKSVRLISNNVNTKRNGIPVIVFNPSSWERECPVEVEPWLGPKKWYHWKEDDFIITDENGMVMESQNIKPGGNVDNLASWVFIARVPSLGYRTFYLVKKNSDVKSPLTEKELSAGKNFIQNRFLRVEINPETGWIDRLYDIKRKINIFKSSGNVPVVIEDKSDSWGHEVEKYRKEVTRIKCQKINVIENGPVRVSLRIEGTYHNSKVSFILSLYKDINALFFESEIFWIEKYKMLKLSFDFNLKNPKAIFEIPYGSISRVPDGRESVGQTWVQLQGKVSTGSSYAIGLVNDSKYAYDINGSELRITVLRSVPYAWHRPHKIKKDASVSFLDHGIQRLNYILKPSDGIFSLFQLAEEINMPFIQTVETNHSGTLPGSKSFLKFVSSHTMLSVLKKSEEGSDICLRFFEVIGKEEKVKVSLYSFKKEFVIKVKPYEIKTIIIRKKNGGFFIDDTDLIEKGRR